MIHIVLTREIFGLSYTLGTFKISGDINWQCYTCEDTVRGEGKPETVVDWKIKGASAIPYGTYDLAFTYSPKYKKKKWEVLKVPGFQGIRIHSGNNEFDTEGCILLGDVRTKNGVVQSKAAVDKFEAIMAGYTDSRIPVTLEITSGQS